MSRKVAVIVGSLREGSYNRKLAKALTEVAPEGLEFDFVEIGDLPLYNPDLDEGTPPEPWGRFRSQMKSAEAVLFVTPEYNRGLPAAVKNALDVGSRPYGDSIWDGKPTAVVTGSPGGPGGFGANHQLRQSMVFLNMYPLQQPEAYIGNIMKLISEDGEVQNEDTKKFLGTIMSAFAELIEKHL
ncbi:NADPH-dependent FMN reductase [Salipiger sp. PrR002]|uniref:NADPH-dependent FMN reductase n=1 Tax=Salipiger sp. PrR002 TaxID=2706489 RepID=UPI0013B8D817|nr:NAD(P)H-dependent oxidoreductase [Salipiger sp. PrR002]NDV99325.1 NAD(P)H-dependent oxidoreductase [Salipiger sp. PrR002]NDW55811.1 NAD(P)H-dependent oxidoreductase [Salipiger sp. PrR004]